MIEFKYFREKYDDFYGDTPMGLWELIIQMNCDSDLQDIYEQAYVLATVKHETGNFMPQDEWGFGKGKPYGIPDAQTGQVYYGRGYVQLTWKTNYQRFSHLLGIDLVNNPGLANQTSIAYKILSLGMRKGLFTGKKFEDYRLPDGSLDYVKCRRIVNGKDKAEAIAKTAKRMEECLRA